MRSHAFVNFRGVFNRKMGFRGENVKRGTGGMVVSNLLERPLIPLNPLPPDALPGISRK